MLNDGPFRPDADERLKRGDLRNVRRATCPNGHTWLAPTIGRCPTCRTEGAVVVEEKEIAGIARV